MDASQLPPDVEELKALLLAARNELATSRTQVLELSSTVSAQEKKLEQKEQLIRDLLKALRGKQRERINPDQLLLFDIGELEQLIEEKREDASPPVRWRKKHGRSRS